MRQLVNYLKILYGQTTFENLQTTDNLTVKIIFMFINDNALKYNR